MPAVNITLRHPRNREFHHGFPARGGRQIVADVGSSGEVQEKVLPFKLLLVTCILNTDTKVVRQQGETVRSCTLEFLAAENLHRAHDEPSQSLGGRLEADEPHRECLNRLVRPAKIASRGPGMKEVRNCLFVPEPRGPTSECGCQPIALNPTYILF